MYCIYELCVTVCMTREESAIAKVHDYGLNFLPYSHTEFLNSLFVGPHDTSHNCSLSGIIPTHCCIHTI